MQLTLTEITEHIQCRVVGEISDSPLSAVSTDSRTVKTGELFVALRGEHFDGHDFVHVALEKGAVAALVEHDYETQQYQVKQATFIVVEDSLNAYQEIARYYRRKMHPTVIALTGSAGKTTCKEFMAAVLAEKYNVHKNIKSFNNHVGVPATLLELQPEHDMLVAELGTSDFGEISQLSYLVEPDVCALLNIGYAHVEFLHSLDGVAKAKMEIFDHAASNHIAFYNNDDPTLRRQRFPSKRIKTFGIRNRSDVQAKNIECRTNGNYAFDIDGWRFQLSIPGMHNVYNALAAIAVAEHFAVPLERIAAAIQTVHFVEHRMNVMNYHDKIIIDDAYNANPGSCAAALQTMADIRKNEKRRRIAVLGDMLELGEFAESEHKKLATVARDNHVDALFLYGEQMQVTAQIAEQMSIQLVKHYKDQQKLVDELLHFVADDDIILVKGSRSMHMEHVVNALLNELA